jgi:hypothetical protein
MGDNRFEVECIIMIESPVKLDIHRILGQIAIDSNKTTRFLANVNLQHADAEQERYTASDQTVASDPSSK